MDIGDEMRALLEAMTGEQLAEWMNLIAAEMQRRRHSAEVRARQQIVLVK